MLWWYTQSCCIALKGCPSPVKDLRPEIVADAIEVLLIEQDFTDGPVKGTVRQVRHHILPVKSSSMCQVWGDDVFRLDLRNERRL